MMCVISHVVKTTVVLAVLVGRGSPSQTYPGLYNIFNNFVNNNAVDDDGNDSSSPAVATTNSPLAISPSTSPSPLTETSDRTGDFIYQMRERSRTHRLESLRNEILRRLGMDQPPTVSPESRDRLRNSPVHDIPTSFFTPPPLQSAHRRCYSASCDVPHKVNTTLWRDSSALGMRLYIPIPRDRHSEDTLQSASLHLFLRPNPVRRRPCSGPSQSESGDCHEVSGLLVSVYHFVRPLSIRRRRRVVNRRRLLDAKFVAVSGNTWLTFNVGSVAMDWRRHRRNFGLEIIVKDDNDTQIDATSLFVPPDCSVGREIGCRDETPEGGAISFPWVTDYRDKYPYLDLTTVGQRSAGSRSRRSGNQRPRSLTLRSERTTSEASHTQKLRKHRSCRGRRVRINISDPEVLEPRSIWSRVCPTTCWNCSSNKQCERRPCSSPKTEAVTGHYRAATGQSELRTLPLTKIVACGC
ncbi:uncharacterized protein [Littorina saxatilis]|uniref:uncharacterized protein n=1 Tax=Littorina saxatilis TaxID=31220 RepID=UPI0038B43D2E